MYYLNSIQYRLVRIESYEKKYAIQQLHVSKFPIFNKWKFMYEMREFIHSKPEFAMFSNEEEADKHVKDECEFNPAKCCFIKHPMIHVTGKVRESTLTSIFNRENL